MKAALSCQFPTCDPHGLLPHELSSGRLEAAEVSLQTREVVRTSSLPRPCGFGLLYEP